MAVAAPQKDDSMQLYSQLNSVFFQRIRLLLIIIISGSLAACAGKDGVQTEVQNITEAYELAELSVSRGNYRKGIQIFEAILARYPFSDLSRQIELKLLHAYYKSGQVEQAIETADTFMRENPTHPRVDYALYIMDRVVHERRRGHDLAESVSIAIQTTPKI